MNSPQIEQNNERWSLDSFFNDVSIFDKNDDLGMFQEEDPEPNESEKNTQQESDQKSLEKSEQFLDEAVFLNLPNLKEQVLFLTEKKMKKEELEGKQYQKMEINCKNQTKNIPKNFGKAIITFILKSKKQLESFLQSENIKYSELIYFLKPRRKRLHSINELKKIWIDEKYGKALRAISESFLKKRSFDHIFNSRITHYGIHIKYRSELRKILKNPEEFHHLKFNY